MVDGAIIHNNNTVFSGEQVQLWGLLLVNAGYNWSNDRAYYALT